MPTYRTSGAPKPGCLGWGCLSVVVLTVIGGCGAAVHAMTGGGHSSTTAAHATATVSASAVASVSAGGGASASRSASAAKPRPRVTSYTLPDLKGQRLDKAEATLKAHRIGWKVSPDEASFGAADFHVCSQSVKAGTVLRTWDGHRPSVRIGVVGNDLNCDGSEKSSPSEHSGAGSGSGSGSGSGGGGGNTVPDPGAGATAQCNDGSYSYSAHHQGTCSHHGGVAVWFK